MILGQLNTETTNTEIRNSTNGPDVLTLQATGSGVGVRGTSDNGPGVLGTSVSGEGVVGVSGSAVSGFPEVTNGVHGLTDSFSGVGVIGENTGGGTAVGGISTTGDGVGGTSSGGTGVHGRATAAAGVGMLAENTGGGTALQVAGPAVFSRSGLLTVAAGKSSGTVTGVALTAASLVLATVQQHIAGVYVQAAVPNITGSSFTVYLSKAPTASAKVAWFVVN